MPHPLHTAQLSARSKSRPCHAHAIPTPATRLAGGNRNRLVQHEIQRQALPPTLNHLNSWLTVTVPAQHSSALRAIHAASPPCFDPPPSAPAPAKTTRGQRKTTQGSVETVQVGEHQLMNPDKMSMQPQSTTSQSSEIKHSRHRNPECDSTPQGGRPATIRRDAPASWISQCVSTLPPCRSERNRPRCNRPRCPRVERCPPLFLFPFPFYCVPGATRRCPAPISLVKKITGCTMGKLGSRRWRRC